MSRKKKTKGKDLVLQGMRRLTPEGKRIWAYLDKHPDASTNQVIKDTDTSGNVAIKWIERWQIAKAWDKAQADDQDDDPPDPEPDPQPEPEPEPEAPDEPPEPDEQTDEPASSPRDQAPTVEIPAHVGVELEDDGDGDDQHDDTGDDQGGDQAPDRPEREPGHPANVIPPKDGQQSQRAKPPAKIDHQSATVLVRPIVRTACNMADRRLDRWDVEPISQEERDELTECWAVVYQHYYPHLLQHMPLYMAIMYTGAVLGPRIIDARDEKKRLEGPADDGGEEPEPRQSRQDRQAARASIKAALR